MKVKEIMSKKVIYAKSGDDLQKVLGLLVKHKISGLPVVDKNKKVVGVVSETDLLKAIDIYSGINTPEMFSLVISALRSETFESMKKSLKVFMKQKVIRYMKKPITIEMKEDVYNVMRMMNKHDIDRLIVTEKGRLKGIITRQDIIKIVNKITK